ncbi:MAG: LytR/AlgR family response regulator transcription factor [Marinifilaceae bacterium]
MSNYTAIIIDDEQLAIDVIENYLARYPQFQLLATFTNPEKAFAYLNTHRVDLAFTDIAMPNIQGTELVKLINSNTQFVMVTSYSNYAIESFELDVVDYLLKPVPFDRFAKTIDRFLNQEKPNTNPKGSTVSPSFFIKEGDEYVKVYVKDIDYIEGMKDYAKIYCGKNYYMALKTLKSLEEILAPYNFMRVHKSHIIPLEKITQFNGRVVLIDRNEIPVGSSYREGLKEYLNSKRL